MKKVYLYLYPLFIVALTFGFLYIPAPKAKAALAGDNGPILYIDNPVETVDEDSTAQNSVETTDKTGSNQVTAATSDSPITTATISEPTTNKAYDIVYGTQVYLCQETPAEGSVCTDGIWGSDAYINKVTIDSDRQPVASSNNTAWLPPLSSGTDETPYYPAYDWITQTSISPDSSSVLIVRTAQDEPRSSDNSPTYFATIETVNSADITAGNVTPTTIVAPQYDPCLNGGYAQNGAIYYTSCPEDNDGVSSDLYFVSPGATQATALGLHDVNGENDISPFFIDVTPDSSQVLVADISSEDCNYNWMVFYNINKDPGSCDYYYVSTTNGLYNKLANLVQKFVPTFFSPDGNYIIGSLYNGPEDPTAIVSRLDLTTATTLNGLTGVQEWAPAVVAVPATTITTTPAATSTTPTLPNTGANSNTVFALAVILIALGASTLVRNRKNI